MTDANAEPGADPAAAAPDELLQRLRRFHDDYFPGVADRFHDLVRDGQHPTIRFIGCSDSRIVVCGHTHCGGIRALYEDPPAQAVNLKAWLELAREAVLPVQVTEEALRRTEQRAIVLQLERLMAYPMVRTSVEAGGLALQGWHYVLEDGEVHVFDVQSGQFLPATDRRFNHTSEATP